MNLPSRLYEIKVEQVNGPKWAATTTLLPVIKRFLQRKRREYGDIRIVYFNRLSNEFTLID